MEGWIKFCSAQIGASSSPVVVKGPTHLAHLPTPCCSTPPQRQGVRGEAPLCGVQLRGHRHRHEPLGGVSRRQEPPVGLQGPTRASLARCPLWTTWGLRSRSGGELMHSKSHRAPSVCGWSGSDELTLVAQPHTPISPTRARACFLNFLASVRGNLSQAQHKLPGLSYLKGAF